MTTERESQSSSKPSEEPTPTEHWHSRLSPSAQRLFTQAALPTAAPLESKSSSLSKISELSSIGPEPNELPEPEGTPEWHLVEIPDGELPTIHSGPMEQILPRLLELEESRDRSDTIVFVFYGLQAHFSKPPMRHLVWPGQKYKTPLFVIPGEEEDLQLEDMARFGQDDLPLEPEDEPLDVTEPAAEVVEEATEESVPEVNWAQQGQPDDTPDEPDEAEEPDPDDYEDPEAS